VWKTLRSFQEIDDTQRIELQARNGVDPRHRHDWLFQ
jgi:hypothetical protein